MSSTNFVSSNILLNQTNHRAFEISKRLVLKCILNPIPQFAFFGFNNKQKLKVLFNKNLALPKYCSNDKSSKHNTTEYHFRIRLTAAI
jgi:hypothetical protein